MKKKLAVLCIGLVVLASAVLGTGIYVNQIRDHRDRLEQAELNSRPVLPEPEETGVPQTSVPEPVQTEATSPPQVLFFTPEEEELLLQLGMAERGETLCPECIALVMRTVLNRVESERFPSTVRTVIFAENQFTPVAEGTFYLSEPNEVCREALQMIREGWDESQGALYYEWCEGESWHSQNLNLLFQHCDIRFYN